MHPTLYIPRVLTHEEQSFSEHDLLKASDHILVLAEPGAGKTDLLHSFANELNESVVTASVFCHTKASASGEVIIVDAFDELAKVDAAGVQKILGKISEANPSKIIIASRSSEWNLAATHMYHDFFGENPFIVRLKEFDEQEQKSIFDEYVQGEIFSEFRAEVEKYELEPLLPNPQFLKLLADAYIESGRRFDDKRSIFSRAIDRLAKEANNRVVVSKSATSVEGKIQFACDVFAKLLLSGAEGVSTSETNESEIYPLLSSLVAPKDDIESILATRLFKPGENSNQHRPVHKIVAEYCAAQYLINRIADSADPLSLSKCLSVIAPTSIVRDELRGMLGWMAALGSRNIQKAVIALDAYAVLANGDPSQLENASKIQLINGLVHIADQDPFFRRADWWRRFSVAGFFTQEVIDTVRPLLAQSKENHLRDLLLELLCGSQDVKSVTEELLQIVHSPQAPSTTRFLAREALMNDSSNAKHVDIPSLIFEASGTSLKIAAITMDRIGPRPTDIDELLGFFRVSANLFQNSRRRLERIPNYPHFLKPFIAHLEEETIVKLLDRLSSMVVCSCGKKVYECYCRIGLSKVVGLLLDRYFDVANTPYDPQRIWSWVCNLKFENGKPSDKFKSVQVLRENRLLREGLLRHVFGEITDREKIYRLRTHQFDRHAHSGLVLEIEDHLFLAETAFHNDNATLWASFIPTHHYHNNNVDKKIRSFRKYMRATALKKPAFMKEWVQSNRETAAVYRKYKMPKIRRTRREKRENKRRQAIRLANAEYVKKNRKLIESGRHFQCLSRFAELVLHSPDEIESEFGDKNLVYTSLNNCLDFIAPYIPSLQELAEDQCASKFNTAELILYAACLEVFKNEGSLDAVDKSQLAALKTNHDMYFDAESREQRDAFQAEVDRLLFPTAEDAESFCREYVEPQLAINNCSNPQVHLLNYDEVFEPVKASLSFEWLNNYGNISLSAQNTLFNIAVDCGSPEQVRHLIEVRCDALMFSWPPQFPLEELRSRREFWFSRALIFLGDPDTYYWHWFKSDKNRLLCLEELTGSMNRSDKPNWPKLNSRMIEAILDGYYEQWPKVDLPNSWGTTSPPGELAYRFLTEIIWSIGSDSSSSALEVLDRLITDHRYYDLNARLLSIRVDIKRRIALAEYEPPVPREIVDFLDKEGVISVEDLRQLIIRELQDYQLDINGGEFNTASVFFENGVRLGEVACTERIAERLNLRLEPQNISITPEHQLKGAKRSDFTATKMIQGSRKLLVTEVKGQWNRELYTAACEQLHTRYSIHPDAEQQGVYLVLWFGQVELVAGKKSHSFESAEQLKLFLEKGLPEELKNLISVFVLDLSGV